MPDNRVLLIVNSVYHLLTAVYMFRASGAMEYLGALLAPALERTPMRTLSSPMSRRSCGIVCLACRKLDYSIGCCLPPCRR